MKNIRSPFEKLAGCYHLARFVDKIRLHLSDALPEDYQFALFHPKGVDGTFLKHFDLTKEAITQIVQESQNDDPIATWFNTQIPPNDPRRQTWNDIAPNLGKTGYPMTVSFRWAKKKFYTGEHDPSIDTIFKLIDADEGR